MQSWWSFAVLVGSLAVLFGGVAPAYLHRYALSLRAGAAIYGCFLLLLTMIIAPGVQSSREAIRKSAARYTPYPFLLIWCLPYLVYGGGTGDFRWTALVRLLAISALVLLVYRLLPVRDESRFCRQDAAVGAWLVMVVLSHQLAGIWTVPVNLDFMGRLFLIAVASWCWVFVRGLPGVGYDFTISPGVVRAAAVNFLYFAAIAIPASLALHFTRWNPRWHGGEAFCLAYVEIFLFVALLEELFFRGFLQNLLSRSLGSWVRGQIVASCLFGLFHILHAPFPNWRYVALASVAGWFYGSAFRQSGSLMASAMLHAAVDTVWRTWMAQG